VSSGCPSFSLACDDEDELIEARVPSKTPISSTEAIRCFALGKWGELAVLPHFIAYIQ
jgi:hypothetical protein